jgi:hypothetical protein
LPQAWFCLCLAARLSKKLAAQGCRRAAGKDAPWGKRLKTWAVRLWPALQNTSFCFHLGEFLRSCRIIVCISQLKPQQAQHDLEIVFHTVMNFAKKKLLLTERSSYLVLHFFRSVMWRDIGGSSKDGMSIIDKTSYQLLAAN